MRAALCVRAWPGSPRNIITTTTFTDSEALLTVERRGEGHAVGGLRRGARLAPRVLDVGRGGVRACVLPTQAGPLSGDHDRVRIVVGAAATLIVRPVSATVALPGALITRLNLDVEVGRGARLVLEDAALIVASGADVVRSMTLRLAAGAVVAFRDTVVLGRTGEAGGRLVSTVRVTDADGVVLHDALRLDPAEADAHVALAPRHRVVGTLCLLGYGAEGESRFALARGGLLRRATASDMAELEAELAEPWARWSEDALLQGPG